MNHFLATFSHGETFTRMSEHPYRYAIGFRSQTTGKLSGIHFTTAERPAADWSIIGIRTERLPRICTPEYARYYRQHIAEWKATNARIRSENSVEIVEVTAQ